MTGGAGYIGSHTAKALARAGMTPVVLDNLSRGHRWSVQWGPLVEGDLVDKALVRDVLSRFRIEAVIHFAALAYVDESMREPARYFQNNVVNSLNLLEAMESQSIRHIVFSSSCATYGIPAVVPIAETAPQQPVNPYGESKLTVERMLAWYRANHGLSFVGLRYFNAAGADPEGQLGEMHEPETHVIPRVLHAAAGLLPEMEIYGADFATPDGTAVRDYVHVADLADAHVMALHYLMDGGESAFFNLGTGSGHSVREIVAAVERASGRHVRCRMSPRRPGDPPVLIADATLAQRVLGWQARHALDSIVGTGWSWQVAHRLAA